jgi:hypothetical protein
MATHNGSGTESKSKPGTHGSRRGPASPPSGTSVSTTVIRRDPIPTGPFVRKRPPGSRTPMSGELPMSLSTRLARASRASLTLGYVLMLYSFSTRALDSLSRAQLELTAQSWERAAVSGLSTSPKASKSVRAPRTTKSSAPSVQSDSNHTCSERFCSPVAPSSGPTRSNFVK